MNDPNGLVYYDGEYHLFYQHIPNAKEWGFCLSWGHAVSPDLIHWEHLPVAITPEPGCSPGGGGAWSGGATIDWNNTAGLQQGDTKTMVLLYTVYKKGQFLAYSNDRGRTFKKYDRNPVIKAEGEARDPKVFWHAPLKRWAMIYWEPGGYVFASSPDLKTWTRTGEFKGSGDAYYECPNLFSLPLDGKPGQEVWAVFGAHGKYFLGDFDGNRFTRSGGPLLLDNGSKFYAGQMWNDIPQSDGRRINITWMAEVVYPDPKPVFSQQMTIPTVFTLRTTASGPRIFREPVKALEDLRLPAKGKHLKDQALNEGSNPLASITDELLDITAVIDLGRATQVGFRVRGADVNEILYDVPTKTVSTNFPWAHPRPKHGMRPAVVAPDGQNRIKLRLLLDRSVAELFVNDGEASFSELWKQSPDGVQAPKLFVKGSGAKLVSLDVYPLRSIWTPGALEAAKKKAKETAKETAGATPPVDAGAGLDAGAPPDGGDATARDAQSADSGSLFRGADAAASGKNPAFDDAAPTNDDRRRATSGCALGGQARPATGLVLCAAIAGLLLTRRRRRAAVARLLSRMRASRRAGAGATSC